jgi:hypothetical protein
VRRGKLPKRQYYREPFRQSGSILHEAWRRCVRGIPHDELVEFLRSRGADPNRILREIKKGTRGDFTWDLDDANGMLKIKHVRRIVS